MRPRYNKQSGRYRGMKQQSCPQYPRSTWPAMHTNDSMSSNDRGAAFLTAMKPKSKLPLAHSGHNRSSEFHLHTFGQKTSFMTSSMSILRSLGDMDDTEDETLYHRDRFASDSSQGSCDLLRRQAASMGSLTSSYSSLSEQSASTISPDEFGLKRFLSKSLKATIDPDFSGYSDYDHDPKMRETVEDLVSPKAIRTKPKNSRPKPDYLEASSGLAAVDPSILVALPGRSSKTPEDTTTKYFPTTLCDLSVTLSASPTLESAEAWLDLAQLRVGTQPVETNEDLSARLGWDIPEENDDEPLMPIMTRIPYSRLSESSESEEECCIISNHNLSQLSDNLFSSSSSTSRSRSSLSSFRDSSDYLADISDEEVFSKQHVTVWPPCKKLKINLKEYSRPFVLSPRIPGVEYCDVPTKDIVQSPGRVSKGIDAFFNSRSIVHRLGPHGRERVFDMEPCPEKCGFAYPVPHKQEVCI